MTTDGYATPAAFRAALTAVLKKATTSTTLNSGQVRTAFLQERVLARVFGSSLASQFMLKGGGGLVVRLYPDARFSRDLDLSYLGSIDKAIDALRQTLCAPSEEHVLFSLDQIKSMAGGQLGVLVTVKVSIGAKEFGTIPIDLVVGRAGLRPDRVLAQPRFYMKGLSFPSVINLLPIEIQVAQKLCAIYETRGAALDIVSTRYRDLVDLVSIAIHCALDAKLLAVGIQEEVAERRNRGGRIVLPEAVSTPGRSWVTGYRRSAQDAGVLPSELADITEATKFVGTCLNSILDGSRTHGHWVPSAQRWMSSPDQTESGC